MKRALIFIAAFAVAALITVAAQAELKLDPGFASSCAEPQTKKLSSLDK